MRRFLCILSGDDYAIIREVPVSLRNTFAGIGVLIGMLTLLSVAGWMLIWTSLLDSTLISIVLSIFFSWVIGNMYLLTVYTFSKSLLPSASSKKSLFFSNLIKYLFIALIGIIIGTPFIMLGYESEVSQFLITHKEERKREYKEFLDSEIFKNIPVMKKELQDGREKQIIISTDRMAFLEKEIRTQEDARQTLILNVEETIQRSSFYLQSIKHIYSKATWSIPIALGFVLLFVSPLFLKHQMRNTNEYFTKRKEVEMKIIEDDYTKFKSLYSKLLSGYSSKTLEWKEAHIDPPYNTKKIPVDEIDFLDQDLFIHKVYNGES